MSEAQSALARGDLSFVDEPALTRFVTRQRWFASKAREVAHLELVDVLPLWWEDPPLALAFVEVRFHPGTHETYQLPFGLRPAGDAGEAVAEADGWLLYDALADPHQALRLVELIRAEAEVRGEEGVAAFRTLDSFAPGIGEPEAARPVGAEQSNTSIVFDEHLVLKAYRRLEPGPNPELELLRFLTDRGFGQIAALAGWYEYAGRRMEATLGVMQEFLAGARDGWELALDSLADGDAERLLERIRELGEVTGELHTALASEGSDPTFAPEDPGGESFALLMATIDEEIERVFVGLPGEGPTREIVGRGEDVREQLRLLTSVVAGGKLIRTHGDYHLGQTLLDPRRGWVALDFEGEPARPLSERRRKRSPLRDVAGMLRSFAYLVSAARLQRGVEPPADFEERARAEFLAGYLDSVEPTLLPPGQEAFERMLAVFELEKAVYELRYELNNRPDWVGIPVAGILRLLEVPA